MHFPYDEVYHKMGILWRKITHAMGKVWVPVYQVHPIRWALLHFPVPWETDGESHTLFHIWWNTRQDVNLIGKKHPYYRTSMSTNFAYFPHTIGFVAFSPNVRNWWENPYISHMMKLVIFFLWISLPCSFLQIFSSMILFL